MKLACWRGGRLLAARQAGLGEADRLWLEDHLGGCESCRTDAVLLAGMTRVALSEDDAAPRRAARVDRAIAAALAAPSPVAAPAPRVRWILPALAFAAVTAGALFFLTRAPAVPVAQPESIPAERTPLRPEAGPSALVDGHYQLAHAEVDLSEGAEATWMAESHQVILHRGRLRAHVDKAAQERFSVVTPQFIVEVIGTRFEVAADTVTVEEGVVHVLSPDGQLLAEVRGGGRWSLVAPPANVPDRPVPPDVARELAAARKKLAARDVSAARRHLERAREGQPSTAQQAEAETLTAEIHLVEGHKSDAAAQYLRVSERFSALPAGENALWAAASLRARLGEIKDARALAERYLRRYPNGRFHGEASSLAGR